MTFGFRLLILVFWAAESIGIAFAQPSEDDFVLSVFASKFGEIDASCDGLVVAEFGDWDSIFNSRAKPRRITFDQAACSGLLKPALFASYLKPFFNLLAKENFEKTSEAELAEMQDRLQERIRPLASVCRKLGNAYNEKEVRVCYFGAPGVSAGLPFRSLFRSMYENAHLETGTVCAPDPLVKSQTVVPELQQFLKPQEESLSWTEVQKSLLNDGFECRGEGDNSGCKQKLIMIVITPASKSVYDREEIQFTSGTPVIVPRELSIYKGKWREFGPVSGLNCLGPGGRETRNCKQPSRGSAEGICTSAEDWHTWYALVMLLNKTTLQP